MKAILDLTGTDLESTIQYKISSFPDGQQTVDITSGFISTTTVQIRSRLNTFRDLELILCATNALKNIGINDIELYVPYFMGGRSDRKFGYGGVNYLKQIISPIINAQNFSKITVLDPHSDVLEAVLYNFEKNSNFSLVKFALTDIDNKNDARERICLVSPDAGAFKKIFDVAREFNIDNIISANKIRDLKTGNIIRTEIPDLTSHNNDMNYVIVDDICDGGRTFIELAKVIKETKPEAKIYLVVTHGIFSAGFKLMAEHLDGIYCTNSYRDVTQTEYIDKIVVKQINIFV
jgi:ribose-phosphate pyrophosphokinase